MRRRPFVLGLAAVGAGCATGRQQSDPRPAVDADPVATADPRAVVVGGCELVVIVEGRQPSLPRSAYVAWVQRSAQMITDYYGGRFPVPGLEVTLVTTGRGSVGYGHHTRGRWIKVHCGRRTKQSSLDGDWVMVHEMLHATFPNLDDRHRWMQEGLSTYLEKIVRARAGDISEEDVWRRLSKGMHHGRPRRGDRGLDNTHTWGNVYWGGALFWMVADIELRRATSGGKGLREVLLAIAAAGGNARKVWSTQRVCEAADAATNTTIVSELYAAMAHKRGDVELDALWEELGVIRFEDGSVELRDDAPLSAIRHQIVVA